MGRPLAELLSGYHPDVSVSAATVQQANIQNRAPVLVVLDDDPTGTQSVADLPVLMRWEKEDFEWAFQTGKPAIYVMTNSRSLTPEDAKTINEEVVKSAYAAASGTAGLSISFVSRSDSTLRGHFPLEPYALADSVKQVTGKDIDGIVVLPAFADAGRITIGGVHYAGSEGEGYTPVGETEFAKDATFGYQNSELSKWIEEKTGGEIKSDDVLHIDLGTLRTDPQKTVEILRGAQSRQAITCDSVTEDDLRLLALALNEAESQGSTFLYRVGPPFVRARIGQEVHLPLTNEEVERSRVGAETTAGGLIVIGSHVALTTKQLDHLREAMALTEFEIEVPLVLDTATCQAHLDEIVEKATESLDTGHVVVRTSRTLVKGEDGQSSLEISRRVSRAVVDVVHSILAKRRPGFVIAKGGITSSDVAAKGLEIRQATVIGPMLPGIVSLWSGHNEPSRGIPYIVFAGNVGDETSLAAVVEKLSK